MGMYKIVGHKFVPVEGHEGALALSNSQVISVLNNYNLDAIEKIHAFKEYQKTHFKLNESFGRYELNVFIKDLLLPTEAIDTIINKNYCIVNSKLFFFDEESVEELKNIFQSKNPSDSIVALSKAGDRGILEDEVVAYSKQLNSLSIANPEVGFLTELYPYQKIGLDWLSHRYSIRGGALLADDMGLGKTAQVIALIAKGFETGSIKSVLIVVPNSLIANWLNEFKKFTTGLKPFTHWGSLRAGFSQEIRRHKVIITTYTTVVNDVALFQKLNFDLAVFDEASLLKNPDSQRTKSINTLNFSHGIAITGTPFENSMLDLWSITDVIKRDFLGTRDSFASKYIKPSLMDLGQDCIDEVENNLRPILLRRMKEEVLTELPPKLDIYKPLTMGEREQLGYFDIERKILENPNDRASAFTLISHLRKYSAHPLLIGNEIKTAGINQLREKSSKFEFLDSMLNQVAIKKQKAIVFANHIALLDAFLGIFNKTYKWPTYKIDGTIPVSQRQEVIDDFSSQPEEAFLFLNPVTAGMGLNITSANHVFHYSRQWNPALEAQATARAYRNGQDKNVNVYYMYYSNSIEEIIHNRIFLKNEVSSNLIRASQTYTDEEEMILELLIGKENANQL
jgi:SNF2 family DNA or RNA helicase